MKTILTTIAGVFGVLMLANCTAIVDPNVDHVDRASSTTTTVEADPYVGQRTTTRRTTTTAY